MDAFELLKKDHKKVSQLFQEVEAASGQAKKHIFSQLKTELDVHAKTEERIFYPALENKDAAREITLEAYEEHNVVKDLLAELDSGDPAQDEWDAKLTVLKENVEHHVEEEEGELFSKARQVLSKSEIEELGVEMEAEKATQLRDATAGGNTQSAGQGDPKSSRGAGKKSNGSESAGVLARLANLVGLGGGSATKKDSAKRRRPSKAVKPATSKKAGKKTRTAASGSKKQSSKTTKKATKKSATKSTKAARSRGGSKKPATRRASEKKTQGRTTSKRGRSR
ncbi:MAG TPA: hemerythrin domain-containing protein [Pyrinomonadaceae bacterium]|nr:hemerythrin domain-containing protein [Pyrinomonadaceae bacterium]